jgi:hypothetical protein
LDPPERRRPELTLSLCEAARVVTRLIAGVARFP